MPAVKDGTISALNGTVEIPTFDSGILLFTIQTDGSWDGTLILEGTNTLEWASPHYSQLAFRTTTGGSTNAQHTTANTTAMYMAAVTGFDRVRIRASAYAAGTATIKQTAQLNGHIQFLGGPIPTGTSNIGYVGGDGMRGESTLTRPANTTAYTAEDEMTDTGGAVGSWANMARTNGGGGLITRLTCAVSSNAATKPELAVFIYDTTTTPETDNDAFTHDDTENGTVIGVIDLTDFEVGDPTSNSGNFVMDSGPIAIPFQCATGSMTLYYRVKVKNAYQAGANSDTYKFRLHAERN